VNNQIEIVVNKEKKIIIISKFAAMDGWDLQRRFKEFAMSKDSFERRAYILDVLMYAKVKMQSNELPLTTDALIDNHLQTWENIEIVFNEILQHNGIDPTTHALKDSYWNAAGEQLAVSFLAEVSKLIVPMLEYSSKSEEK